MKEYPLKIERVLEFEGRIVMAYERIGYPYDKQINLLDILNNRSINNVDIS